MRHSALTVAVSAALAAGCTGSTDPETAGLFDNIANFSSGEYDRQIAGKQGEAVALTQANAARQQEVAALGRQRASNANAIAALQGDIAAARRQAATARAALAGDSGQLARLERLEAQIDSVAADARGGADPAVMQSEIDRISDAIRALSS